MKAKRRCMHGKRLKRSPMRNITIAPSPERKKNYTGSTSKYSPENTEGNLGSRLVKALTPKNTPAGILGAVVGGGILKKAPKILKAAKMFMGGKN
tara:strand:- start:109 stop:393 length:285 start_codon:yes stop_codon:yes gene_type:complete